MGPGEMNALAKSHPSPVEWTLKEATPGQPKPAGPGRPADPLLVRTGAALGRHGPRVTVTVEERIAERIPGPHGHEPVPPPCAVGVAALSSIARA